MKEILEALKEWIIWKLSIPDEADPRREEIEFLRKLVEESVNERAFLVEKLSPIPAPEVPLANEEELRPIYNNKYIPFHVRRQKLEEEDRKKARELDMEAKMKMNQKKTTEELEQEILNGAS